MKFLINQYLRNSNPFFLRLLGYVSLLMTMSIIFSITSAKWLYQGVNYFFTTGLLKYLIMVGAFFGALFLWNRRRNRDNECLFNGLKWDIDYQLKDVIILLIPLTTVAHYIVQNRSLLAFQDILTTIVLLLIFVSLCSFVLPSFFTFLAPRRGLMAMGLSFSLTIVSMALLSDEFQWFHEGNLIVQIFFLTLSFMLFNFLINWGNHKAFLFVVLGFFLINIFSTFLLFGKTQEKTPNQDIGFLSRLDLVEHEPLRTPSIYLLVYDSYVNNETLIQYGIDNQVQENFLHEQGFILYPHTYSIGGNTLDSMSSVLNIASDIHSKDRKAVSGDGIVHRILKQYGYETIGIFPNDYMFRGIGSSYDYSSPEGMMMQPYALLTSAILIGEFNFDLGFYQQTHLQFTDVKSKFLRKRTDNPIFFYSHSDLPGHSQNSGVCLPDEIDIFKKKLTAANIEMKNDVLELINTNPEAIIIIAGDHGPYLTKNCDGKGTWEIYKESEISRLDIQDRLGSFLAIKWPDNNYIPYDEITILQDIFPTVFAYMFDDRNFLEIRVSSESVDKNLLSGVYVKGGVIYHGINDGEKLFISVE